MDIPKYDFLIFNVSVSRPGVRWCAVLSAGEGGLVVIDSPL